MSWHDYEPLRPNDFVSVGACRACRRRGVRLVITLGKGTSEKIGVGDGDYVRIQFGKGPDDRQMRIVADHNGSGEGNLRKLRVNSRSLRVEMGATKIIAHGLRHETERVKFEVEPKAGAVRFLLPRWVTPWGADGGRL